MVQSQPSIECQNVATCLPRLVLEEVDEIWADSPGRLFEQSAFGTADEPEPANIGGTFPTIDDFRDGVATSLKTINIV